MRFEEFVKSIGNLAIIHDYVISRMMGRNQSARNLVHRWCSEGKLIRMKRGMYILREGLVKRPPFFLYQIANTLVSPSYISLDSALSYHELIPERIVEATSVCLTRTKSFINPLGTFSYKKLDAKAYAQGIHTEGSEGESFLIADKEKALLDKIYFSHSERYFYVSYLLDSLRMEENDVRNLNIDLLERYARFYPAKKMMGIAKSIRRYHDK